MSGCVRLERVLTCRISRKMQRKMTFITLLWGHANAVFKDNSVGSSRQREVGERQQDSKLCFQKICGIFCGVDR